MVGLIDLREVIGLGDLEAVRYVGEVDSGLRDELVLFRDGSYAFLRSIVPIGVPGGEEEAAARNLRTWVVTEGLDFGRLALSWRYGWYDELKPYQWEVHPYCEC